MPDPLNIAMWSGPRNLSTAMMHAFGNRADMDAVDEPFYAAFLHASGLHHPVGRLVMAAQDTDPARVAATCAAPQTRHRYMKHMAHHMLPEFPLDWAADCVNIHLLRHPARVIASYLEKRESPTLDDIGFTRQAEIFERFGGIVIGTAEIRAGPRTALTTLCDQIGLPFSDAMLSWPAGPKPYDGAWAPHWYNAVHTSTGFAGPEGPLPELSGAAQKLCDRAMEPYRFLKSIQESQ